MLNSFFHGDFVTLCESLEDNSIDMILTDPPYGTTACSWDTVVSFEDLWKQFTRVIKPRGAIVMTAAQPFTSALVMSWKQGFRQALVWDKKLPVGFLDANRRHLPVHEDVLIFGASAVKYYPQMTKGEPYIKGAKSKAGAYGNFELIESASDGTRYPTSILEFSNANRSIKTHPTQKPVKLFEYLIKTYTLENQTVLDPFCGSGTTAIACMNTGRNYICGDSSAEYIKLAKGRAVAHNPFEATPINETTMQLSLFEK